MQRVELRIATKGTLKKVCFSVEVKAHDIIDKGPDFSTRLHFSQREARILQIDMPHQSLATMPSNK